MKISAQITNRHGQHIVALRTEARERSLSIPPGSDGFGCSVNGGELLFLALATCYCNDLYREARKRNLEIGQIEVEVTGDFSSEGVGAQNIAYSAHVSAGASAEEILGLMRHTDSVAEIQNTLRSASVVTLARCDASELELPPSTKAASVIDPQTGVPMTTAAPLLNVRNGAAAIDFYKAAFSAREISRIADPEGAVVAHLAVAGSDFWLADEAPVYRNFSPESLGGSSFRMVLTAPDPDALFDQAVAAGATVVCPVRDESYGWRIGRVVDPFGHHWEIGRPLA